MKAFIGKLFVPKEIFKACQFALSYLKDQIAIMSALYDPEAGGVEIHGYSHLFEPSSRPEVVPWFYPVITRSPKGRGYMVVGLVKSEHEWH